MNYLTSGNDAVDQVGRMNIAGNIVPAVWFKTILTDSGRPYYLAIMILSDIVYWYRPTEIRDERTGQLMGWKKKFHNDMLQRNYEEYAALMGESERSVIRAIAQLEQLGVVIRHRQDLILKSGLIVKNVLFLELVPARLYQITFEISEPDRICKGVGQNLQEPLTEFVSTPDRICKGDGQNLQESLTEFVSTPDRICKGDRQNLKRPLTEFVSTPDRNCKPYTNIITNTTTESISINPSIQKTENIQEQAVQTQKITLHQPEQQMDRMDETAAYMELIRENIEYDWHKENFSRFDWDMFDELYHTICDIVCVKRKTIRVNDEDYPYELVKSRYLKLTSEHLKYVIECMKKTTTPVRNIRSYMITALYNSANTIDNYYTREAMHDMYGSC